MRHGTRYAYSVHRCRCPRCTRANRDYGREYQRRRAAGLTGGYGGGGHLCTSCGKPCGPAVHCLACQPTECGCPSPQPDPAGECAACHRLVCPICRPQHQPEGTHP